jgi:hypothetical protein
MLLLQSAARRGTTLLGRVFRVAQRERRPFPAELPAREWNKAMGLLRLRLHEEARGETSRPGQLISGKAVRARSKTVLAAFVANAELSEDFRDYGQKTQAVQSARKRFIKDHRIAAKD